MASVEGLTKVNQMIDQSGQSLNTIQREQAAKQAADLFNQGDVKGALMTMARVDPDHAASLMQQFQQFDPNSQQALHQAQTTGQMAGASPYESTPGQVAHINADARIKAAEQRAKQAEDQLLRYQNAKGETTFISKKDLKSGATGAGVTPAGQSHTDVDSNGNTVTIGPKDQKMIESVRKQFDSDTKDITKGLDAAHQGMEMVQNPELKGVEALERLRILRSVVQSRISQQEFQAFGGDMGAVTSLENKLQKVENGTLTPEMRQIYTKILDSTEKALSSQYDAHLKNALERTPEIDPLVLKKRLIGSSGGPAVYQQITKKVSTLPPEAQALFNWAHDNPGDPRAPVYLKQLSEKYKLGK